MRFIRTFVRDVRAGRRDAALYGDAETSKGDPVGGRCEFAWQTKAGNATRCHNCGNKLSGDPARRKARECDGQHLCRNLNCPQAAYNAGTAL